MTAPVSSQAVAQEAHDAAMIAHDFFLVVSLALSTEAGQITLGSQEAIWTVTQAGVEKARLARDAIDRASTALRERQG